MTVRRRVAPNAGIGLDTTVHPPAGIDLGDSEPWMADALCAQTDPEAFYPEKGGSTRGAKAICRTCEVRADCLEFALDKGERYGIWGGLSERERRKLESRRGDHR